MKKNFLITTALPDTWEINENNFLLGTWCEFHESNFLDEKASKNITIIKNIHHWDNLEKKFKDYKYIEEKFEHLLEIISDKLSLTHNVKESKEYWRTITSGWLSVYITQIFDRWECVKIFFEENKNKKFYSNFVDLIDSDFIPYDSWEATKNTQTDLWNHFIFLRLFNFLNIENISLVQKKIEKNKLVKEKFFWKPTLPIVIKFIKFVDNIISHLAFRFNKVIIINFHFPKKEYLKICLRCKLIPCKYSDFFDFRIKENDSLKKNSIRNKFKNLLIDIKTQDRFVEFVLQNIHKDIPKSFLENFDKIKKKILPLAKKKKTILDMYSLTYEDNFKIYLAETKKVGSKYTWAEHGGGLTSEINALLGENDLLDKVADTQVRWDNTLQKKTSINLSPTLPIIKFKNKKIGKNCSIILYEQPKYINKFALGPSLNQSINFFNEITEFVKKLDPEIKSRVKFRAKLNRGFNAEKKIKEIFNESNIDKVSFKNSFSKTLLNSKLVIITYPQTTFSEAMYANVPTILIIKENFWKFTQSTLHTFNDLKKNNIAFEDFEEAKTHVNKHWKEIDLWWKSSNVQLARKNFLLNFFNVKLGWYKEWSDYIYSLSSS